MAWSSDEAKEQKERVERELAKRRRRGETFEVLAAPGGSKKLCTTFWGHAWCRHLETFQEYESRLPRGRSYLRKGQVYNLAIEPGCLTAVVAGAELYDVRILIEKLPEERWKEMVAEGTGQVGSMLDLLAGKLGDGLMELLIDPETGLFPQPKEIRLDCSCPDFVDMCKHVSAVLYGVGVKLDTAPELLFTLRGVDQSDLLEEGSASTAAKLVGDESELAGADLSDLFGIELGGEAESQEKSN